MFHLILRLAQWPLLNAIVISPSKVLWPESVDPKAGVEGTLDAVSIQVVLHTLFRSSSGCISVFWPLPKWSHLKSETWEGSWSTKWMCSEPKNLKEGGSQINITDTTTITLLLCTCIRGKIIMHTLLHTAAQDHTDYTALTAGVVSAVVLFLMLLGALIAVTAKVGIAAYKRKRRAVIVKPWKNVTAVSSANIIN